LLFFLFAIFFLLFFSFSSFLSHTFTGSTVPPSASTAGGSIGKKLKLSVVVAAAVAAAKAANPSSPRGSTMVASTDAYSPVSAPASPRVVLSPGASRKSKQAPLQTIATPTKGKAKTLKDKIVGVLTPKRFNHQANIAPQSSTPASPTKKNYQVDVNVELCGSPVANKATQRFSDLFDSPVVSRDYVEKDLEEVTEEVEAEDETSPVRPQRRTATRASAKKPPAVSKKAPVPAASKTASRASKRSTAAPKKEPTVAVRKTRGKSKVVTPPEDQDDGIENTPPPAKVCFTLLLSISFILTDFSLLFALPFRNQELQRKPQAQHEHQWRAGSDPGPQRFVVKKEELVRTLSFPTSAHTPKS
jgi:hypothetical protein